MMKYNQSLKIYFQKRLNFMKNVCNIGKLKKWISKAVLQLDSYLCVCVCVIYMFGYTNTHM